MNIQLFNTLTGKKEILTPHRAGAVSIYVCGPTVYSDAHIGHALSVIVFDVLRRFLEFVGHKVKFVMNFTDVDDKIIQRAQSRGVPASAVAEEYVGKFLIQLQELNVLPATCYPRVSKEMDNIIKFVGDLESARTAYMTESGDVYFRVASFPSYGKLSGQSLDALQANSRKDLNPEKESSSDFALWKAAKAGEPFWESPWGKGRPGWHIECSSMIHSCFGDQIDIHGGGSDLIFPHHENEIAQSESRFGKPLAHIWMHNGMLQIHGEKMSKSLGNLMTIDEFNSKFGAGTLRLMVLLGKYRNPLNFNDDLVSQAQQAQAKLRAAVDVPAEGAMPSVKLHAIAEAAEAEFKESLADDLTTARAVAALFKPASSINSHAARQSQEGSVASAQEILKRLVGVLGITVEDDSATMINMTALKDAAGEINAECESESTADVAGLSDAITTVVAACQEDPPKPASIIDSLIALREQLRRAKKFELADRIRGHLKTAGVELHDGKASRKWSVSR